MSSESRETASGASLKQQPKSKRRKNVSIGLATWSRLRTHGIYGDSLDDILNRLMDKADELSRRNSKSEPSGQILNAAKNRPQQQTQQKDRRLIEQSRFFKVFERDTVEPKTGERAGGRSIELVMELPGIRFPINKSDLLDFAIYLDKEFEYDQIAVGGFYYGHFLDLPDKIYTNKASLEEALVVMTNPPGGNHGVKFVGVNILTTKEELEKVYHDSSKRQADEDFKKGDEYYRLDKEQKKKIIEEQKRKLMEQSEEARRYNKELKRQHEEFERRELEQQREQEEGEREMEEAAVEKTFKPVETDL